MAANTAQRENVDVCITKILHRLHDLVVLLAKAQHQAGFGEYLGTVLLGMPQHFDRLFVTGTRITHRVRQAPDRLYVLREDLEAGIDDQFDMLFDAVEIRR